MAYISTFDGAFNPLDDSIDIVHKYYLRKNGAVISDGYDWIGRPIFGMFPAELNNHLGFLDATGKVAIPIIYDIEQHLNGTLWLGSRDYFDLKKNGLCGLVKHDGTVAVDFVFEKISLKKLNENMLPVLKEGKWGFVNVTTGFLQIPPFCDDVDYFLHGFAPFCIERKWGFIDKKGNILLPASCISVSHFDKDFAIVLEDTSISLDDEPAFTFDANYKVIFKTGQVMLQNCSSVKIVGPNTFFITKKVCGHVVSHLKQYILLDDVIVVIDNGFYLSGFVSDNGTFYEVFQDTVTASQCKFYSHAKYAGGGRISAITLDGKSVRVTKELFRKALYSTYGFKLI